jgi:hypothetical protein
MDKQVVVFFRSTIPRNPIIPHRLLLLRLHITLVELHPLQPLMAAETD